MTLVPLETASSGSVEGDPSESSSLLSRDNGRRTRTVRRVAFPGSAVVLTKRWRSGAAPARCQKLTVLDGPTPTACERTARRDAVDALHLQCREVVVMVALAKGDTNSDRM